MDPAELERRFMDHPPRGDQPARYSVIRKTALELAELINDMCPDSREKDNAIQWTESVVFWANASIARHE